MIANARRPLTSMIIGEGARFAITVEQLRLSAYLFGHTTLEQFWDDDGLDRFHVNPMKNFVRKALWSQLTAGQLDQAWWQRLKQLVDHATMREVDKLEEAASTTDNHKRDWQRFRTNLCLTGGCLIWGQLSEMAGYRSLGTLEKKFERGDLLALGTPCFKAFYPIAQFGERGNVIKGVREVHAEFEGDIVESFNFLVEKNPRLDGRPPIDLLRDGQKRWVIRLARVQANE